jgi:hypothetical protein
MEVLNCDDLGNINARIADDDLREWLARAARTRARSTGA